MRLFLSSTLDGSIDLFMKEYGLEPKSTPVVYIPTAENCFSPRRRISDRGSYQCLIRYGFPITVCDLDTEKHDMISRKVSHAKIMVVAGGNTFYLLHHIKRSGFDMLLRPLLHKGMIYVGSSAGSCVCSPNVEYVKDQDDPALAPDLNDYAALRLVDFEIYPHRPTPQPSTPDAVYLCDNQAVVVSDRSYTVVR